MIMWLSFCDNEKPKGTKFLGVAIVEVDAKADLRDAIQMALRKAHRLGINPGGEVGSYVIPENYAELVRPHLNKLLTKAEATAIEFSAVNAPRA